MSDKRPSRERCVDPRMSRMSHPVLDQNGFGQCSADYGERTCACGLLNLWWWGVG